MRRIIIIGSSGGNLYNLGGKDPQKLLGEIRTQAKAAGVEIAGIQFIAARGSMDTAGKGTHAEVYCLDAESGTPVVSYTGTLEACNEWVRGTDEALALALQNGQIDGMISMSADPNGANEKVVNAAVEKKVPIVGTGGTSMALISAKGAHVLLTSGTTGTTNRTRAISFVTAFAKHWGITYRPMIGDAAQAGAASDKPWKRINIRGIMMSSLPGFIALALVLALSKIPGLDMLSGVFDVLIKALPVVIAAIAAKQVSDMEEVSVVAGVLAGILSTDGGIIGGMIGGIGAGLLVNVLFRKCIEWKFPTTTVNIIAGGVSGLAAGLIVYYLLAPIALQAGEWVKVLIEGAVSYSPALAGLIAGLLIWPAIIGGVYHAAILPIVLLEMEKTGNSFLGAVDMVGLVMVSAGITLANIISPREKSEATVATPGFLINMGFGTFVEAAYPFMFSNKLVFAGAIVSSGIAGMMVGVFDVRGTAYVPSVMAPLLSNNMLGFIAAMASGLLCSLLITLAANQIAKKKQVQQTGEKINA
ncbi:PTS sugar transporter [Brevibacillus choshinensis]|uniref:PTS sugar transporter n=1 Tax=Brevibacillus choshinensis TaxID=54911 RepID=A0ABX7FJW0_BRECH|nr:PTS sugar transporter [Brevibacillus choshinensis]QRG65616.1 PTS sugar transporter [Brevibacillus choshinensis]